MKRLPWQSMTSRKQSITGTPLNTVMLKIRPALADADFDHPLDMLAACHGRIEAQCATLQRLASHLPVHGADAQAQQAASNVMRFFDSAGRHHKEDEECDFFPALIAAAKGERTERVALLVAQLTREHDELERRWLTLRDTLEMIAHGEGVLLDVESAQAFCAMYREHMTVEEEQLIPLAAALLGTVALRCLSTSMARRRGVKV